MLVHPARAANLEELPDKVNRGIASVNDVFMVCIWSTIWRLFDCTAIQHTIDCTAAVLYAALWSQLGTVSLLRTEMASMDDDVVLDWLVLRVCWY